MEFPKFSIIIPVQKINSFIRKAVPFLLSLDYPNFEIIIVTDKQETSPWKDIKIIGGVVGPAQKRDAGEKVATGDYIALIDDDAYPHKDWLKNALKHFKRSEVAAVCGPGVAPPFGDLLEEAANEVSVSKLCWGNVTFRNRSEGDIREVDDYITANLIIRRSDYNKIGGFCNTYWPGEDTSFCLNIVEKLNKKIIYDPSVVVYHYRRRPGIPYLKQVGSYGLHRGYFARILPKTSFRLPYFVPSLFILGVIGGAIVTGIHISFPAFLPDMFAILTSMFFSFTLFYLFLLMWEFFKISFRRNIKLALLACFGIFSVHIWYGLRFLQGFLFTKNLISKYRN